MSICQYIPPILEELFQKLLVDYLRSNVNGEAYKSENLSRFAEQCRIQYKKWPILNGIDQSLHLNHHEQAIKNFLFRTVGAKNSGSSTVAFHPSVGHSLIGQLHAAYTATHDEIIYYAPLNISNYNLSDSIEFGPWRIRALDKNDIDKFSLSGDQKLADMARQCLWLLGSQSIETSQIPISNGIFILDSSIEYLSKYYDHYYDDFCEKCILTLLLYPWENKSDGHWAPFRPPKFLKYYSNLLQPLPTLIYLHHLPFVDEVEGGPYFVDEHINVPNLSADISHELGEAWNLLDKTWNCVAVRECRVFRHFFIRAFFDAVENYLGFDQVLWHLFCIDAICDKRNMGKDVKGKFLQNLLTQRNDPVLSRLRFKCEPETAYKVLMGHRDDYVHGKNNIENYSKSDILKARGLARAAVECFLQYCRKHTDNSRDDSSRDNFIKEFST